MKVLIKDKYSFARKSLYRHSGILLACLFFFSLGAGIIFIGVIYNVIVVCVFGGIFAIVTLIIVGSTLPSSLSHYYQKEFIKKYGSYDEAIIITAETIDVSYQSELYDKYTKIEEYLYLFNYKFEYNGIQYESSFLLEEKDALNALPAGSKVPIQFLRNDPTKSKVRIRKLSSQIGIPLNMVK